MAMRTKLRAAVIFLPVLALAAADWQSEAAARIARESEYPVLVEALQQQFPSLPDKDKAAAALLIGYCQSRLGNSREELLWMRRYLEDFRAADVHLGFLPAGVRQKIRKFRTSWMSDFPVLWELALAAEHSEFAYFDPPAELKLRLQASLSCDFQLLDRDGEQLASGALGKTAEIVRVPLAPGFFSLASHPCRLLLIPRNAPEKTVEKYFAIELEYAFPDEAEFDPQAGTLKLKGREPKPEQETETRVVSQSTRFDKDLFKKTVLKDLLIGAAFFVLNATLLTSTIDGPGTSLYAKSALYGTRRVFTLAGIGFSLAALSKLPKLFKRQKVVEEKSRDLPEARAANQELERDLALARKKVRVRLTVKAIG